MRGYISAFLISTSLVAAGAANAAVPLSSTVTATPGTSNGITLTANAAGNNAISSASGATGVALVPLSQFNPNTGILLGARVTASVPVSLTTVVTGVVPANGNGRTITSGATYTGAITAPGISIPGTTLTATKSCSGGNCANSPSNQTAVTTGTISGNSAVSAASLSSYYGNGSVSIATEGALNVTATNGTNVTTGKADATVARTAGASYSIAYDYLNFSSPSFSGSTVTNNLSLDFGEVRRGSGPVTLSFTLFNIGNANSAGFDLLALTGDNGNSLYSTTLVPFSNSIGGGMSRTYSATLDPGILGGQFETFRLRLKDSAADVGSGIGGREYDMTLNLAALIVLPDPGTWATMIAGFGLVGAAARRRRALGATQA